MADTRSVIANGKRHRVSGVDRAFQILDHLLERKEGARPVEIARAVGAPTSTVYEIVENLLLRRVLARDDEGHISLGPRLFHYGLAHSHATRLMPIAEREMRRLSLEIRESVQICGRDDGMMVVLGMVDGPGPFRVTSHVGTRVPLNWTASGLLLTGHLSLTERTELYRRVAQPSPTGKAKIDPAALASAAEEALRTGLSVQVSAADFGVACIAAPIIDSNGGCVATISIVLPEMRAGNERYACAVRQSAQSIEAQLGWDRRSAEVAVVVPTGSTAFRSP
jgi:DNA-binding IclR family transcriptional regulator